MSRLTPHQKEAYDRLVRIHDRLRAPVEERFLGNAGAYAHLVRKGWVKVTETSGPRGGVHRSFEPERGATR